MTMGSFDGAEICELVGLVILDKQKTPLLATTLAYSETMDWQRFETWDLEQQTN